MMDSLLLKQIKEIHILQDTLMKHLDTLQSSVDKIQSENVFIKFLPFIGVVIGGLIAYFGQFLLKNKDFKIALIKETRETGSNMAAVLTSLKFSLRELAYLEVDSKYQYHLSCKEETGNNQNRALEEHYNDYKYIAEYRNKVGLSIAELNGSFLTYYKCSNTQIPEKIKVSLDEFINYVLTLPRPPYYQDNADITTEMLQQDIDRLAAVYTQKIYDMQAIVAGLT